MFLGAGSVMHGMNDDVNMRHYGALPQGDADDVRDLRDRLPRDHRRSAGSPASGPRTRSSRPRFADNFVLGICALLGAGVTGVLHDPPDAADLLDQEALGARRAPARVAQGDDVPADRARRAVGCSAACCSSTTGSSDWLSPVVGEAPHEEPPLPAIVISLLAVLVVAVGVGVAWMLVGRSATCPGGAPTKVSVFTTAGRDDLYGDALQRRRHRRARPPLHPRPGHLRPDGRRRRRRGHGGRVRRRCRAVLRLAPERLRPVLRAAPPRRCRPRPSRPRWW